MKQKIDKAYISEHDIFLHQFDKANEQSPSQKKEAAKFKKIHMLRDRQSTAKKQGIIVTILSRLLRVFHA